MQRVVTLNQSSVHQYFLWLHRNSASRHRSNSSKDDYDVLIYSQFALVVDNNIINYLQPAPLCFADPDLPRSTLQAELSTAFSRLSIFF